MTPQETRSGGRFKAEAHGTFATVTALASLGLLAGCLPSASDPASSTISSAAATWDAAAAEDAEYAPLDQVSDAQRAALADGAVTFEEYEAGVQLTLDCMRDAGIDVINDGVDDFGPFPMIYYSYATTAPGLTEDQTYEISQGCIAENSYYLEAEYQTGAAAQEAIDAYFAEVRDEFIACLEDQGQTVSPDATDDELRTAAMAAGYSSEGLTCFDVTGAR